MEHGWTTSGIHIHVWTIFRIGVKDIKWSSFFQVHLILESLFVKGIFTNHSKSIWGMTIVFIFMVLTKNKNNSRKLMVFANSISKILV
jgi:hypothetical protein